LIRLRHCHPSQWQAEAKVPESYLHYQGLKPGQQTWYFNARREFVPVYPGDWVRLDLSAHPEVKPAIQAGTAIVEESIPPDVDALDDTTNANRDCNEYGKIFSGQPRRRQRSRGCPEVYGLTTEQLGVAVRCFLPWPGWQAELDSRSTVSEARSHRRGARPNVSLPMPFDMNFPIIHRIAELIYRQWLVDVRQGLESRVDSHWDSGEYPSKTALRKSLKRRLKLPSKREAIGEILQLWGSWIPSQAPSSRTIRRYRAALGPDCAARTYADEQILEVLKSPCQRIILGPGEIQVGAYVPGRAAAAALTTVGPTLGPVVLDIRPAYEGILQSPG
jgi:hypothetical protein